MAAEEDVPVAMEGDVGSLFVTEFISRFWRTRYSRGEGVWGVQNDASMHAEDVNGGRLRREAWRGDESVG